MARAKRCICGHLTSEHYPRTKKRRGAPCYFCDCKDLLVAVTTADEPELTTTQQQEGGGEKKCLNMIWANEAGVSVYVFEGGHGRRVIEIHRVNTDGYEEVAATATIEKHNRERMVACFADTKEERMQKFVQRFNVSDKDLEELAKIKPPIKSAD